MKLIIVRHGQSEADLLKVIDVLPMVYSQAIYL